MLVVRAPCHPHPLIMMVPPPSDYDDASAQCGSVLTSATVARAPRVPVVAMSRARPAIENERAPRDGIVIQDTPGVILGCPGDHRLQVGVAKPERVGMKQAHHKRVEVRADQRSCAS